MDKKIKKNKDEVSENNKYIPDVIEFPVKKVIQSKTLWVNLIAFGWFIFQQRYGFPISMEVQAEILALVNMVLRILTDKKLRIN